MKTRTSYFTEPLAITGTILVGVLVAMAISSAEAPSKAAQYRHETNYGITVQMMERDCREYVARAFPIDAGWTAREQSLEASECLRVRMATRDANRTAL